MYHQSDAINDRLAELEAAYVETGDVTADPEGGSNLTARASRTDDARRGSPDAPF